MLSGGRRAACTGAAHPPAVSKDGNARQAVWDALGKHAYTEGGKNRMAVVDGTVGMKALPRRRRGGVSDDRRRCGRSGATAG